MEFRNYTPFPGMAFKQYAPSAELFGIAALRGSFRIVIDQPLALAPVQAPLALADVYEPPDVRPEDAELVTVGDIVPFKPGTDVTVRAVAHTPQGRPEPSWEAGFRIGPLERLVRVHGPRYWQPTRDATGAFGWHLSESEPCRSVPVSWRLAHGGWAPGTDDGEKPSEPHLSNPLGPGQLDAELSPRDRPLPAPRIEAVDAPITDWRDDPAPQGLAPLPPYWEPRASRAGTYDERWLYAQHPFLPPDFEYAFYQSAPPEQVIEPWLAGAERMALIHLHPLYRVLCFDLPGLEPVAVVRRITGEMEAIRMALDGVHVDLLAAEARVFLTWRTAFPWKEGVRVAEARLLDKGRLAALPPADAEAVGGGAG